MGIVHFFGLSPPPLPIRGDVVENIKNVAPGEARTPDLRISLSVLTYKYDALTDCATGAVVSHFLSSILWSCKRPTNKS